MSSESLKARDSRFYCFLSDCRARIFDSARLGLVCSEEPVSGPDFTNRRKSRARVLKHGSRRLGESRILPFYTPKCRLHSLSVLPHLVQTNNSALPAGWSSCADSKYIAY